MMSELVQESDPLPPLYRIYFLLSGKHDQALHQGLDWHRSLGLFLWYHADTRRGT